MFFDYKIKPYLMHAIEIIDDVIHCVIDCVTEVQGSDKRVTADDQHAQQENSANISFVISFNS